MSHHAHPDPEVAFLVEHCAASLAETHASMGDWLRMAASGQAPVALPGRMPCDARRLHGVVTRLCDEGGFDEALLPALVLITRHPGNAAFAFLAATCLQRTGQAAAALMMFGMAGLLGADTYAALAAFRSGECLAALGKMPDAIHAFEAAIEASRKDPELAPLQHCAQEAVEALRAD